jgi:hypothetical protein
MDGVAATYSPQPWTQYFAWILLLNPFWSLPLFWGSLRFWFRDLREGVSAFVWAFFFFHVLMTNKDFRFLFPVLNLAAVMAAASLSGRTALWWHPGLLSIQGVTACLGFIYTSLQSAAIPELWAIETMHRYRHEGGTWITPGMDLNPLKQSYYPVPPLPVRECRTPAELRLCLSEISGAKVLVSFRRNEPASEAYLKELTERGCRRIESTHPDWLFRLEGRFSALGRLKYKAMYRCLSL